MFQFVDRLSSFLSAPVTALNYSEEWIASRPANTTAGLSTYMDTTWSAMCDQEQIQTVRAPFFADYTASHAGRLPYVNLLAA